ncbi:hypothetical protein PFISCL1PPCAC_13164, partial [Pristionchus fissidentatus]
FLCQSHNTEVGVYRLIGQLKVDLAVPECYYFVPFTSENSTAGSLALKYFGNTKVIHVHNMSADQVRQIARALGKIHDASSRHYADKEPSLNRDTWTKFRSQLQMDIFRQMMEMTKRLDETLAECIDAALELLPDYFGSTLVVKIHEQMLVNVDLNATGTFASVLFDEATCDLRAIIDWQISHTGVGVEDLLRISMSGLKSAADRFAHMPDIANEIFGSMERHLDGAKAPYS